MPQDVPDAVDVLAPFEGSYDIPGFELRRRWFSAREITPEFRDEVLALIRTAFNNRVSWFELPVAPEDHFDWKFRDRPVGATAHTTIDSEGRVVGFTGGVRRIWFIHGRPHVARAGYDLCLSPDWQGQGVQRAHNPFGEREWHPSEDLGVGYVTHPADRHLAIEGGNKAPANDTHDYVRHLRPLRGLLARLRPSGGEGEPSAAGGRVSNTAAVIRSREAGRFDRLRDLARRTALQGRTFLERRPGPRQVPWNIVTLSQFEESHRPFVDAAMSQFDFVAERPIDYLNWRYCDERAGPFEVRAAELDGELLGYAVTRVFRGGAQIADILALPGRTDVAESLIWDAVALAEAGDAGQVTVRLPHRHPYRDALRRCGFFDVGHVAGEVIAPRRMPGEELAFLDREDARIHLVFADSDFL